MCSLIMRGIMFISKMFTRFSLPVVTTLTLLTTIAAFLPHCPILRTDLMAMAASTTQYENTNVAKIILINAVADQQDALATNGLKARLKTKEGEPFSQHYFDADLKMLAEE